MYFNELYDFKTITANLHDLGIRLLESLGVASVILAVVYFIFRQMIIGKGIFFATAGIAMMMIVLWRLAYKLCLDKGVFNQKIVMLGGGALAQSIFDEIASKQDCGYSVSAVISTGDKVIKVGTNGLKIIQLDHYNGLSIKFTTVN